MTAGDRDKVQGAGAARSGQKKYRLPRYSAERSRIAPAPSEQSLKPEISTQLTKRLSSLSERDPVKGWTPDQYWQSALDLLTKAPKTGDHKADSKARMKALASGSGFSPSQLYGSANPERSKQVRSTAAALFAVVRSEIETLLESGAAPNPRNLESVIRDNIGKNTISDDIINYVIAELRSYISSDDQLKRKYRRRAELPDPTQPADAEVNRPTHQLKIRVEPVIAEAIDAAVEASGQTRSEWMADAAIERIQREKPELLSKIRREAIPKPDR